MTSETVYAVVHEDRPGDGSVAYKQEARIVLDRRADVFSSDDPSHEMVAAVRQRFEALRVTHTADEVRRAVVRTLQSFAAVTLRESGGIYWVPFPFAAKLRQLQAAVEKIGSSQLYLLPVHRTREAEKTLSAVAKGSLESELAALAAEVEEFWPRRRRGSRRSRGGSRCSTSYGAAPGSTRGPEDQARRCPTAAERADLVG